MNILFVYDSYAITNKLLQINKNDIVYLFALTSKKQVSDSYADMFKAVGCGVEIINSSRAVNGSANGIRQAYIRFIAELPYKIQDKGKNLKEIFSIDAHASLWWFSLIAEKNTHKSDTLARLSQLDAITEAIKPYNIEKIIINCNAASLSTAITEYANDKGIPIININSTRQPDTKAKKIIKQLIGLFYYFIYSCYSAITLRKEFTNIQRAAADDNALMLITYYPNMDISEADKGRYADRNYPQLQDKLSQEGKAILWMAMYVENNSITKDEAMRYARTFINNGEHIYFLDEFNTLWIQLSSLAAVLFSAIKFLMLEKKIKAAHTIKDYNIYALARDDWYRSFMGTAGYQGLLYYKTFKNMLSRFKVRKYLYLFEQQAWEKAFISAKKALNLTPAVLGSQSGTVSEMLLNFFNSPSEICDTGRYAIPGPDIAICNGRHPYGSMLESGWPRQRLRIAEAVRYSHLIKYLGTEFNKTENIVLLACSISIYESSSMLNVLYEALNGEPGVEVWIKPHPFLQIEKLFQYSEVDMDNCMFKIKNGPVGELLQHARVVVVGESSVCIEAIACGCEVFIVNVPEWITMSPLVNVGGPMIKTVSSAEELRQNALKILGEKYVSSQHKAEAQRIINEFFYFNDSVGGVRVFYDLVNE
ncbi:MAG: hypothetical protein HQL01_10550 [Nitrospirae bacterium]|nr:hypothetical protein [Nitrospirota bacterium]